MFDRITENDDRDRVWNRLHEMTTYHTTTVFGAVVTRNNSHTWTIGTLFGEERGGAATTVTRIVRRKDM